MTREQWLGVLIEDYHNGIKYNYLEMLEGILKDWHLDQLNRNSALKLCQNSKERLRIYYDKRVTEILELI